MYIFSIFWTWLASNNYENSHEPTLERISFEAEKKWILPRGHDSQEALAIIPEAVETQAAKCMQDKKG